MAKQSRCRIKGRKDTPGGFAGIPKVVMDHPDYKALSGNGVKLLLELARQYNGRNNGDLSVAYSLLKEHGFKSKQTISRATSELMESNMIIRTRDSVFDKAGGRCALYAITWKKVDECFKSNLQISPSVTPTRQFSLEINKSSGPENGPNLDRKRGRAQQRDGLGRFSSDRTRGRLTVVYLTVKRSPLYIYHRYTY